MAGVDQIIQVLEEEKLEQHIEVVAVVVQVVALHLFLVELVVQEL